MLPMMPSKILPLRSSAAITTNGACRPRRHAIDEPLSLSACRRLRVQAWPPGRPCRREMQGARRDKPLQAIMGDWRRDELRGQLAALSARLISRGLPWRRGAA